MPPERDERELEYELQKLYDWLRENQRDLEPDFAKVLYDHFWELYVQEPRAGHYWPREPADAP